MSASITVTPAAPVANTTAMNIVVTGNPDNGTKCYLMMDHPAGDDYKSQVFSGNWTWMTVIPNQVDTLTIRLRKASDNSDLATTTVSVG